MTRWNWPQAARYNVARVPRLSTSIWAARPRKSAERRLALRFWPTKQLVRDILHSVVGRRCARNPENSHRSIAGERNGVTIARIAEDAGIAALAVHGRTRACAFEGEAEYDTIADIVAATEFPVFANGDIDTPEQGRRGDPPHRRCRRHGRPRCPGPTLVVRPDRRSTWTPENTTCFGPPEQQFAILQRHLLALHDFYGDFMGVRIARKTCQLVPTGPARLSLAPGSL